MVIKKKTASSIQKKEDFRPLSDVELNEILAFGEDKGESVKVYRAVCGDNLAASDTTLEGVLYQIRKLDPLAYDKFETEISKMQYTTTSKNGITRVHKGSVDTFLANNVPPFMVGHYTIKMEYTKKYSFSEDDIKRVMNSKPVYRPYDSTSISMYTKEGEFLRAFYSVKEAAEYFKTTTNAFGKMLSTTKYYKGYRFKRGYDKKPLTPMDMTDSRTKALYILDESGTVLHEFSSTREAAEFIGASTGVLLNALSRGTRCRGYIVSRTKEAK